MLVDILFNYREKTNLRHSKLTYLLALIARMTTEAGG